MFAYLVHLFSDNSTWFSSACREWPVGQDVKIKPVAFSVNQMPKSSRGNHGGVIGAETNVRDMHFKFVLPAESVAQGSVRADPAGNDDFPGFVRFGRGHGFAKERFNDGRLETGGDVCHGHIGGKVLIGVTWRITAVLSPLNEKSQGLSSLAMGNLYASGLPSTAAAWMAGPPG